MKGTVDGERIAEDILQRLEEVEEEPSLEIILVGENEASHIFVDEKLEACERIGFKASVKRFSEDIEEAELVQYIEDLNEKDDVHGVLIQLPLPNHINENSVFEKLDPEKDVDGLTPENIGKTLRGNPEIVPGAIEAVERILEEQELDLEGLKATIVNNSSLIGRPLSMRLSQKGATTTICHRKTSELEKHTLKADIIVTATGEHGLLKPEMISENTVVIDAGYSLGKGDVKHKEEIAEKALLSPVPGGIGPITVAVTLENLLKCYRKQI